MDKIEERYQGIAKPVYDILLRHMVPGSRAVLGKIDLEAEHHTLSFEIQRKLRKLGYHRG